MFHTTLIAATSSFPLTNAWNPKIAIVMILCNIIAIAIGKTTMPDPGVGQSLPMPEMFGGMSWPTLLGTTSLGHIIGILTILLLDSYGIL